MADTVPDSQPETPPAIESPPATPGWVKRFVLASAALALLFAGLHLVGIAPAHAPASAGMEHGLHAP